MNPYLEKQLPLLGDLHKKLGLCQQDLDTDLEAINDAIKRAIDEAIGRRKESVQKLEEDVDRTRTEIRALSRVLDSEQEEGVTNPEPILSKLKAILGEAYRLPETVLRKAGSLEALELSRTGIHAQIATSDRIQALRDLIGVAQAEKTKRSKALQECFDELRFLHVELGLEPMNAFCASRLLPVPTSSSAGEGHLAALHRFISMCQPEEDEMDATVLAEQPTVELMTWAKEALLLWQQEKVAREEQIQALYDELEPLWHRLGFEQEDINAFVEEHCGLDQEVMQAVESEDVLQLHEEEAQRLQSELSSKEQIMPRVEEWVELRIQQQELEAKRNGPDRFNTRGGALLLEERTRKRIEKKMPLLEQELLQIIPPWEHEHDMPFLFDDSRITDILHDEMESRAAERNAKMRSRVGSSMTPARQVRTPAASTTVRTPGTALARKRDAPTPTPSMTAASAASMKRSRLGVSTSSVLSNIGGSPMPKCQLPPPHYGLPKPTSSQTQSRSTSTPMPLGQSAIPNYRHQRSATHVTSSLLPKPIVTSLAKAEGRRPRRQSFKPRQSVAHRSAPMGMRGHVWSNVPENDVM
ncbi:hypothetical protein QFC22_000401 [Naganishia vaughanmartiniae]|uniref:Uncharacterized protein n=1 Tax=Naganishia vaughanmartiniae TaxID=1424756 RepID=A0ACC2XMZ3_9TREE|nr:hypothetical protein QFC22_000401 [Naganishia vaughanmartiniae]